MLESLKNLPFEINALPAAAQKPTAPETPKPLKLMAAKGALPIPPDALIYVWYQLSFDPDEEVTAAVKETVCSFDSAIIVELAQKELPDCILDWLSKTSHDTAVLEKLVLNSQTHDATIMDLAASAPKEITEIISNNHVRILRSPEIIEKLYTNPSTRMATVDKLLALAKEHNLEIPNLKMVQDAHAEMAKDDNPGLSDEEFEMVMKQAVQESEAEKPQGLENLRETKSIEEEEAAQTSEQKTRRLTKSQLIERMNAPQRIKLALLGSKEDRTILLRDTRRVVYMSVIQSPKMTIGEVNSIATSKSMPDEIIGYIAQRRDWIRYYPVVVALVNNPKCPLTESVAFLKQLRPNDLKNLQKSKSIPTQLSRQAQMLLKQKNVK